MAPRRGKVPPPVGVAGGDDGGDDGGNAASMLALAVAGLDDGSDDGNDGGGVVKLDASSASDDENPDTMLETIKPAEVMPRAEPHADMLMALLPFQKEFLHWALRQETEPDNNTLRGGILADEMGMGKTIQTLSLMVTNRPAQKDVKGKKKAAPVMVDAPPTGCVRDLLPHEIKTKAKKGSGGRNAAAAAAQANAKASASTGVPPPPPPPPSSRPALRKSADVDDEEFLENALCLVCGSGDDDENMLLCDGCTTGCYHTYCLSPKLDAIPKGDWFCPTCTGGSIGSPGKQIVTAQGLNAPSRIRKSKATLVICPVVAVIQWRGEIERYCRPGSLKVLLYHGPDRHANVTLDDLCDSADVVLTTYSTIELDYRTHCMPDKVPCAYCGKKYTAEKYKVHLSYFCGPYHKRTAKLAMRYRNPFGRGRPSDGPGGGGGGGGGSGGGGGKGKGKGGKANAKANAKAKGSSAKGKGKRKKADSDSEEEEEEDSDFEPKTKRAKKGAPPPPPPPRAAKGKKKAAAPPSKGKKMKKDDSDFDPSDDDGDDEWNSDLADDGDEDSESDGEPDMEEIEKEVKRAVALAAKEKRAKAASSASGKVKSTCSILHQVYWHRIVLDEAHAIKARQSNTSQAVFDLHAEFRWALSGTPLQNRVGELYSAIRYLRSDPFGYYFCKSCEKAHRECKSLWSMTDGKCNFCGCTKESHWCWWNRHIANPIKYNGFAGKGHTAMMTLKNTVLNTCLLRRTKEQCADDLALPPRTVLLRVDKMDAREEDFYEALYTQSQSKFDAFVKSGTMLHNYAHIFDLLMRLRQSVNHPYLVVHSSSAQATAQRHRLQKWAEQATAPGGGGDMGADALAMQEELEEAEAMSDGDSPSPSKPRAATECAACGGDAPTLDLVRVDCCNVAMCMNCAIAAADASDAGAAICPCCGMALEANLTETFHPCPRDVSTPVGTTVRRGGGGSRSKLPVVSEVAPAFGREGAKLKAAVSDDEEAEEEAAALNGDAMDHDGAKALQAKSRLPRTGGGVGAVRGAGFDMTNFPVKKHSILAKVNLRQFQTSTKLEALREEIAKMKARDSSAKAIIFSQFTNFLDLIRFRLQSTNVRCLKLDGSMSLAHRDAAIEEFTHSPDVDVFLMSLKAGGVALNLTAASHVFLMDPWWNPAVEQQACDRIHRLGQYKPITVVRFITQGTVEERIVKLQEKKSLIFEGTVGGDSEALGKLTEDDLRFLFS